MCIDAIQFMAKMYPNVIPLAFFKVLDMMGAVFRAGYDFRDVENFHNFARQEQEWRLRFLDICQKQWREQSLSRIGRPLCLDDIRLAFRPICESYSMAFVDDVEMLNEAHLLVETSEDNWQAHFCLSRACTAPEVLTIHRYLSGQYNGDTGAHAADQARRLPRSPLRAVMQNNTSLDVDRILQRAKLPVKAVQKGPVCPTIFAQQTLHDIWARKLKQADGDKSRADYKLAIYLLSKGYGVENVCDILKNVSTDIDQRKGRWSDDYISRTVMKAQQLLNENE